MHELENLHRAWSAVNKELRRATDLYGPMRSPHEGYAVLKEEVDELWDDIKTNAPTADQRKEAVQIAAMAIRYILDVCNPVLEDATIKLQPGETL